MRRELSTETLQHQLDAFCSYAARTSAASLESWMESKDFAPSDRALLRRLLKRRLAQAL